MLAAAGKEYLMKLREKQAQMRKEIIRLLTENDTLSFQEFFKTVSSLILSRVLLPQTGQRIHSVFLFISAFPFFLFLTSRTVHTASTADNGTTQSISAIRARLVGVTVHLQKWSIAVALTFCC